MPFPSVGSSLGPAAAKHLHRPCCSRDLDQEVSEPEEPGRPSFSLRRVSLAHAALLLSAAFLAALLTYRWRREAGDARVAASLGSMVVLDEEDGMVAPFKQCGGETWSGNTCCRTGCACIIQSRFFSQCQAPGGGRACSVEKARAEVQAAEEQKLMAGPRAVDALKVAKAAIAAAKSAKEEFLHSQAQFEDLARKGAAARAAKEEREKLVSAARADAALAAKAAEASLGRYEAVQREIEGIEETQSLRSHGKCGAIFSQCGPVAPKGVSPALSKDEACCQEGCLCHWQNKNYAQCRAPPGKTACDPAGEAAHVRERAEAMARLQQEHERLLARKLATEEHAEKVDKEAEDVRHKASLAGARRVHAGHVRDHRKALAIQMRQDAKRLIAQAKHMRHAVHYAAAGVQAWKKAAAGLKCGEDLGLVLDAEGEEDDDEELEKHGLDDEDELTAAAAAEKEERAEGEDRAAVADAIEREEAAGGETRREEKEEKRSPDAKDDKPAAKPRLSQEESEEAFFKAEARAAKAAARKARQRGGEAMEEGAEEEAVQEFSA